MPAEVNLETSTPHSLASLIEAAPGAIVSKRLLQTEHVEQLLFVMDAGEALADHSTRRRAVVHVLEGTLDFELAGNAFQMAAGDWLEMPPNAPHALEATTPTRFLLTLVDEAD